MQKVTLVSDNSKLEVKLSIAGLTSSLKITRDWIPKNRLMEIDKITISTFEFSKGSALLFNNSASDDLMLDTENIIDDLPWYQGSAFYIEAVDEQKFIQLGLESWDLAEGLEMIDSGMHLDTVLIREFYVVFKDKHHTIVKLPKCGVAIVSNLDKIYFTILQSEEQLSLEKSQNLECTKYFEVGDNSGLL